MSKLEKLKSKHKIFSTKEAKANGVSKQLIYHYLKIGILERVSHGIYKFSDNPDIDLVSNLKEILYMIPQGVIGYKTALKLYDLTEEIISDIDVIVPKSNVPKRKLENISLHRCRSNFNIGITKYDGLPITSIERTIIDLLRAGEPISSILDIINTAKVKNMNFKIPLLKKYGVLFRIKKKTELLIEAL